MNQNVTKTSPLPETEQANEPTTRPLLGGETILEGDEFHHRRYNEWMPVHNCLWGRIYHPDEFRPMRRATV